MRALIGIIFSVSVCLTSICSAAEFDPFDGPVPVAVFIQTDPWAMVIGSDTPRVAIYENGDVIFAKKVREGLIYHRVSLDKAGLEEVRKQIEPLFVLKDIGPRYNIRPNVTDQPEAMFFLHNDHREIATSVYGLSATGTRLPGYTQFPTGEKSTVPPDALLKLHAWLVELDYPNSAEWVPKYIEVMAWDYSYAPDASIQWPKVWPSLDSDRAVKRGKSYSIFLDGSLLSDLQKFLAKQNEKGAVEFEGRKMAVSYRFAFPGERNWHKAFAAAAAR